MNRRDFTKFLTASSFMFGLSCQRPEIFHLAEVKQEHSATYENILKYRTNFVFGYFPTGLIIETYENFPFRISGDKDNPFNKGIVPKSALASLYNLYDKYRISKPLVDGKETNLNFALERIFSSIENSVSEGKKIAIFLPFINSPFLNFKINQIENLTDKIVFVGLPPFDFFHSQHQANISFLNNDVYFIPDISRAKILINFGRDFLEHDPLSPFYISRFASNGSLKLFTFEDTHSLTGANSHLRIPVHRNDFPLFGLSFLQKILELNNKQELAEKFKEIFNGIDLPPIPESIISHLERSLHSTYFLCNDFLPPSMQIITFLLNLFSNQDLLATIDEKLISLELKNYAKYKKNFDKFITKPEEFVQIIFLDYGPDFYLNFPLLERIRVLPSQSLITLSLYKNKTSEQSEIFIPSQHYLEFWLDIENIDNCVYSQQQIVSQLNKDSISLPEFIHILSNKILSPNLTINYFDELINFYQKNYINPNELSENLRNGIFLKAEKNNRKKFHLDEKDVISILNFLKKEINTLTRHYYIRIVPEQDTYAGMYSNNVYLKELPSTIDGISWDNPIYISYQLAKEKGIGDGLSVKVAFGSNSIIIPCILKDNIPKYTSYLIYRNNDYFKCFLNPYTQRHTDSDILIPKNPELILDCEIEPTTKVFDIAKINRNINANEISEKFAPPLINQNQMYPNKIQPYDNKWTMIIDVDKCIGCNLCMIACQIENNIPVVGKEQIIKQRDLYWINIIHLDFGNGRKKFAPLMCQHCDYAPCESVCPVGATSHTTEGINEMTYSRCIGSRICMANCPYNVRKFNFKSAENVHINFDPRMTNPFVTLRSRGITEKCTFCIHRINFERSRASLSGLNDFSVTTACREICPVSAISFGRRHKLLNDSEQVNKLKVLLASSNTFPNVFYKMNDENT
ncbi:4Fe-4S dicluster domain-containing protein [Bacteroidetes/Chlorobi group bacterium MS-B_bin-24]|nr:MAG: 4Fe-4S dicluster domain-containing protein [Bacteroidetes/Chlorobi group bacterium MS-B_bin-24]